MSKIITKPKHKTIVLINKGYNFLLEYLFPKFCVGCGVEGVWLCVDCESKILPVATQVCPDCGRIRSLGRYCSDCRKKYIIKIENTDKKSKQKYQYVQTLYLNGIITAAYYEEGPIREIIHHFKYNSVLELSGVLVRLLCEALNRCHSECSEESVMNMTSETSSEILPPLRRGQDDIKIDIITFAPLHFRRLAQRGYNQSELLAQGIGVSTKLSVIKLLVKTKKTKRQVELTGKKRRENLRGVFKVYQVHKVHKVIKNKNILIIDDISTTGATLNECAKVLKEAGAKKVWGLVVARG